MREVGVKATGRVDNSQLYIKCRYFYEYGVPSLVRSYSIKATYLTYVNIKLIDQKTKQIVGEVEYTRPKGEVKPPSLIDKMFNALMLSQAE